MTRVRTTMRPDLVIEVDDVEYLDLKRQGLLVEDVPAVEVPAPVTPPIPPQAAKSGKEE